MRESLRMPDKVPIPHDSTMHHQTLISARLKPPVKPSSPGCDVTGWQPSLLVGLCTQRLPRHIESSSAFFCLFVFVPSFGRSPTASADVRHDTLRARFQWPAVN